MNKTRIQILNEFIIIYINYIRYIINVIDMVIYNILDRKAHGVK